MTDRLCPDLDVSRETLGRLKDLEALVRKWTPRINLVSQASLPDLWERHMRDSAQIYALAPATESWVDLGSGGGFPGLVVAALAMDVSPSRVTLIESDGRKAAFLRTAIRELSLPARVLAQRIEDAPPQSAGVISARALAPLPRLLDLAAPHLGPGGVAFFAKGAARDAEIFEARARWRFSLSETPSITNPEAAVLRIERIERV